VSTLFRIALPCQSPTICLGCVKMEIRCVKGTFVFNLIGIAGLSILHPFS